MSKFFVLLLVIVLIAGGVFLTLNQDNSDVDSQISEIPLEHRTYIAESTYFNSQIFLGEILTTFGPQLVVGNGGNASFIPKWTFGASGDEDLIYGYLSVVSSETPSLGQNIEKKTLASSGGYEFTEEIISFNSNVMSRSVVLKKKLDSRSDKLIRVEIPLSDSRGFKFSSLEEARDFAKDFTKAFNYDDSVLAVITEYYEDFNPAAQGIFGGNSPSDIANAEDTPLEVLNTIMYHNIKETFSSENSIEILTNRAGGIANLCSYLYGDTNNVLKLTFTCNASEAGALLLIQMDNKIEYCADSSGYKGLVQDGSIESNAVLCQ